MAVRTRIIAQKLSSRVRKVLDAGTEARDLSSDGGILVGKPFKVWASHWLATDYPVDSWAFHMKSNSRRKSGLMRDLALDWEAVIVIDPLGYVHVVETFKNIPDGVRGILAGTS